MTALAKLEQVLPKRLKRRVNALVATTSTLTPPTGDDAPVDPDLLVRLALASRDRERVSIRYTAADDTRSTRLVEPTALVPRSRRWYLVCWDLSRNDWRTLRIDRITEASETGVPATPRELPGGGAAAFVATQFQNGPAYQVDVVIHAQHHETARYLRGYAKDLQADGNDRTRWSIQAEHMETLIGSLAWLPCDYSIDGPPEFLTLLHDTAVRMSRASSGPFTA